MSVFIHTDVTAVCIYKGFVLTGNGSYVNVYIKDTKQFLYRVHVLRGQKIYGFVPFMSQNKILVFGGKQFSVMIFKSNTFTLESADPFICDDWLLSGVWNCKNSVSMLTAHNIMQKYNLINKTLVSQYSSKENSILYSGLILQLVDVQLVFAGTVFSEVIIWCCGTDVPLHRLTGHRGVIFSISCDPEKRIIVTTSDDRSVRIWNVHNELQEAYDTRKFWQNAKIVCKHEVYGHTARVMRSCITNNYITSVGEDATICFWNFDGKLAKNIMTHQSGSIWSVNSDVDHLVTGGGDSGVILHPLTIANTSNQIKALAHNIDSPKKVLFTSHNNLVIVNDQSLFYYDISVRNITEFKLSHKSTYKVISVSSCKQIIAICDMTGHLDVFIENCKDPVYLTNLISIKLEIEKVLSMQWAGNRFLVLCSENGLINILAAKSNVVEVYTTLCLPFCKERWLTASAMDSTRNIIVVGDRCGNIHVYVTRQANPIQTFSKVHGRYGPTSIIIRNNTIITTGRDRSIKYFSIGDQNIADITYMHCKKLEFQWVEKFLDKNETMVCGFQERIFVIYDIKSDSKLLEFPCGGGHRSWDAIRFIKKSNKEAFDEYIDVVYIKNSEILYGSFNMSKTTSKIIVNGSHTKEINCLKAFKDKDESRTFYISGGEDTTLRISCLSSDLQYKDEFVFKQLSCIRSLKLCRLNDNKILVVSGGGRAQICAKIVTHQEKSNIQVQEFVDYMIKGTDKERKGNKTWRNCSIDFDPETRIMDLELIKINEEECLIVAGCSDGFLRWFRLTNDTKKSTFEAIKDIKYHETCVLKTQSICYLDKCILISCTTRGQVTFWTVNDKKSEFQVDPVFTTTTNMSGINCFAAKTLSNNQLLIATGGDDNSIHLRLLETPDKNNLQSMKVIHSWSSNNIHCSQITGLLLVDDFMLSTSIDQRVSLCKIDITAEGLTCQLKTQIFSDVADIHGMDIVEHSSDSVTVCVFGKGIEVINIDKEDKVNK